MERVIELTIITPTYNREKYLPLLYHSLQSQTNMNFQWLLIDDGSVDDTEKWFYSLGSDAFKKTYVKRENGGKHRALNCSHNYIEGELVMIVDSDDQLTIDAVSLVLEEWKNYKKYDISLMIFQKGRMEEPHEQLDKKFLGQTRITSLVNLTNHGMKGDHCEVTTKDEFVKFSFPEFDGEKFMSEGWLWQQIGYDGRTVFINKVIYLCEYLSDGLTRSGKAMRSKNPQGGKQHATIFLQNIYSIKIRLKNAALYDYYSGLQGDGFFQTVQESGHIVICSLMYLPSKILHLLWKHNNR